MLDLAAVIRIGPEFSPAGQDRARGAAARDRRLALALDAGGYGLTQTLAAANQVAGDLGRAVPLHEQTLADCVRVLGTYHPLTKNVRAALVAARQHPQ